MVFSSGIYIIQASFRQDNSNLSDAFAGAVKQRNTVGPLSGPVLQTPCALWQVKQLKSEQATTTTAGLFPDS